MGDFAIDTAVEGSGERYRARLSREWEVWGPNGGYVAAIALRAAGAASAFRRPASFSAHFLSVADFDVVDIRVTTLRAVKRAASLRVSMTQADRPILEAVVWTVAALEGLEHDTATMPDVPPPDALRSLEDLVAPQERTPTYPFWNNLETRPLDGKVWSERPPGAPMWRQWSRFRPCATFDDPFVDAARSLVLIDTMLWPAACRAYPLDIPYIAPSLDVTARFHRSAPRCEWLLCDAAAPVAADGLIGGSAAIWSSAGQLLASGGAQLLCRPRPAGV